MYLRLQTCRRIWRKETYREICFRLRSEQNSNTTRLLESSCISRPERVTRRQSRVRTPENTEHGAAALLSSRNAFYLGLFDLESIHQRIDLPATYSRNRFSRILSLYTGFFSSKIDLRFLQSRVQRISLFSYSFRIATFSLFLCFVFFSTIKASILAEENLF